MRRLILPLCAMLTLAMAPSLVLGRTATPTDQIAKPVQTLEYASGVVILKLNPNVPNDRSAVGFRVPKLDGVLQQIGAFQRRPLFPLADYAGPEPSSTNAEVSDDVRQGFDRVYVVRFTGPQDAQWVAEQLRATGMIEFAEPYYFFPLDQNPNDPQAASQYWLSIIKAQQAWDVTQGDPDVVIAICDSGVDWTHEDLTDNIWQNPGETGRDGQNRDMRTNGVDDDENGYVDDWHGWDLVGNPSMQQLYSGQWFPDNDPAPRAVAVSGYTGYHGTTVAGCAAATTNNGKGIAAPGYRSKILAIKCAADTNVQSINAGYDGIRYAADLGAAIINCSFGGPSTGGAPAALQAVVDYALSRNALVVAASGNSSVNTDVTPHYPGALRGVLQVGATGQTDFGDTSYTNCGVGVAVYAPGSNILTTAPGNQYAGSGITGTSFSSPITAGVAALVYARHLEWTPEQIAMQLRVSGDRPNINVTRFGPQYYRRINAYRAVTINSDLAGSTNTMPGLILTGVRLNDKVRDSIRTVDDVMNIELTFRNVLAPASGVTIDAWPGQMLTAVEPVTLPDIPTNGTATVVLPVSVDPNAGERFSDGSLSFIVRAAKGEYEDVFPVNVPLRLPGFKLMASFGGPSAAYETHDVATASPNVAWAIANISGNTPSWAKTINGKTWTSFRNVTSAAEQAYCIAAISADRAWVGTSPSSGAAAVWKTTNGGTNWQKVSVSSITPFVNAVHFWDEQDGIVLGDPMSGRWGIGRTSDGGATWRAISPIVASGSGEAGWNTSYAVWGDNIWFGTNNNRMFRSTDRGLTWTSSSTPSTSCFSIAFTSATHGIAVFKRSVVNNAFVGSYMTARTTNGGASWTPITLPYGMIGDGVTAVQYTNRIMLATESGILETTDLGATWKLVSAPTSVFNWKQQETSARFPRSSNLSASSDDDGKVVGAFGVSNDGKIFGYTEAPPTTGVTVSDDVAADLRLLEPSPNPSTGDATIAFDLRAAARVTLALFDNQGRELRTVFAGHRDAGRHAVVVDGAALAAGTYHVVLTSGDRRVTTPLVIVR